MKKLFCILMCICVLVALCVMTASAETLTGSCGETATYAFDTETRVLTISGSGAMYDYNTDINLDPPWDSPRFYVRSVTIEEGITSIGDYAFVNLSMRSVTISDSITSIGGHAFHLCDSLKNVYYTGDIAGWLEIEFQDCYANPMCEGANLYLGDELLTEVIIPDNITSIGNYTFFGCESLENISVSDTVTSIGEDAFYGCLKLQNTVDNLVYIKTTSNPYFYLEDTINNSITSCTINEGTRFIGSAFHGCNSLTCITVPAGVINIGNYAFAECRSLASITIPEGVTSIGDYAFFLCTSLTSIAVPYGVTSIGSHLFDRCISLTSVTIPDSVTTIGDLAFWGNRSLTSITIPNSVTTIGEIAFYQCENLKNITIPDSVTCIDDGAFDGCDNLTIYCYKGSYAETYAIENNIPVEYIGESTEPIQGDIDGDGEVSVKDVLNALNAVLNDTTLDGADMNGDGKLTLIDVIRILKTITT